MVTTIASILVLAFALSLDSVGVGMTYGMRGLRLPWSSAIVIALCSGLVLLLSMQAGKWMLNWVTPAFASRIGALILIGIGLTAIVQFIRASSISSRETDDLEAESQDVADRSSSMTPVLQVQLRRIGIIIQILRTPAAADIDRSGTISASEAAWLGAALSLDAFGAGIGAAMMGYPPLWTAVLIAVFSGSFLKLGLKLGAVCAVKWSWLRKLSFLPGCVLIVMGIVKLL